MFSLEDQIDTYSDPHYNASQHAQYFFSTNAETEVQRKLNEMAGVQHQIESILQKKVKENYELFLDANVGIRSVGNEMTTLKELVIDTQQLMESVRKNRAEELEHREAPKNIKHHATTLHLHAALPQASSSTFGNSGNNSTGSNLAGTAGLTSAEAHNKEKEKQAANAAMQIPHWVTHAPEDLTRNIIEQRFSQAVALVLRSHAYIESIKGFVDMASKESPVVSLLSKVAEKEDQLASAILNSMVKLPNSLLWGELEQHSRLRLLLTLGKFDMAGQGFVASQVDVIPRLLKSVDACGDAVGYLTELSRVFFDSLTNSSSSFLDMIGSVLNEGNTVSRSFSADSDVSSGGGYSGRSVRSALSRTNTSMNTSSGDALSTADTPAPPAILQMMLQWTLAQMKLFIVVFSRQIVLGMREHTNEVLAQLRTVCDSYLDDEYSDEGDCESGLEKSTNFDEAANGFNYNSGLQENNHASHQTSGLPTDAFEFAATCLQITFQHVESLDRLGLQGKASYCWILIYEVRKWIAELIEDYILEAGLQVRQDEWVAVTVSEPKIRPHAQALVSTTIENRIPLTSQDVSKTSQEEKATVSLSYVWMQTALNNLTDELWLFLQGPPSQDCEAQDEGGHQMEIVVRPAAYCRADLCETEPAAVTAVLRFVIKYVKDLEIVDSKVLTCSQHECYMSTLERVAESLLPSLLSVIDLHFFSNGLILASHSPKSIVQMLITRLGKLIKRNEMNRANK